MAAGIDWTDLRRVFVWNLQMWKMKNKEEKEKEKEKEEALKTEVRSSVSFSL